MRPEEVQLYLLHFLGKEIKALYCAMSWIGNNRIYGIVTWNP